MRQLYYYHLIREEALSEDLDDLAETKTRKQEPHVSLEAAQAERRAAAIERLRILGKTYGLSLGGMTIRQLRDESRP